MKKSDIQNIYSLSPMQESMLFHWLDNRQSAAYVEQAVIRFAGGVDVECLVKAVSSLPERYDVLRTVFTYKKTAKPRQVLLKEMKLPVTVHDLSGMGFDEQDEVLRDYLKKDRQRGFHLGKGPLLRIAFFLMDGSRRTTAVWSFHHIIMDGWCLGLLFADVSTLYRRLVRGLPPEPAVTVPYFQYIRWLESQDQESGLSYWKHYLEGVAESTSIPGDRPVGRGKNYISSSCQRELPRLFTEILLQRSRGLQSTVNQFCRAAWIVLLAHYSRSGDAVFGAVVSGRPPEIPGVERMVGLFINTIPVKITIDGDASFRQLLRAVADDMLDSRSHEYLPLAHIQGVSPLKERLLDHIFVYEDFPSTPTEANDEDARLRVEGMDFYEQTVYNFNIQIIRESGRVLLKAVYNAACYGDLYIRRLLGHLEQTLRQAVDAVDSPYRRFDILPPCERELILHTLCGDRTCDFPERNVLDLFHRHAEERPHQAALRGRSCVAGDDMFITYRHLRILACEIAGELEKLAISPGAIVGLISRRSVEAMVGMLGILQRGAAYLPVDPSLPLRRMLFMLKDCCAPVVLDSREELDLDIPVLDVSSIARRSSAAKANHVHPMEAIDPCSPVYVIYTSGSTGIPKGVVLEHSQLCNYIHGLSSAIDFSSCLRYATVSTLGADLGNTVIFKSLAAGGCLDIMDEEIIGDAAALGNAMNRRLVDCLKITPSHMAALLDASGSGESLPRQILIMGGERLSAALAEKIRSLAPQLKIFNHYGPTEACIGVCVYEAVNGGDEDFAPPIGRPLPNIRIFLLGRWNQPVPIGVPGELCIAGVNLARGYLNRPELSARSFEEWGTGHEMGNRFYRTGDLARFREDGDLEFIGRVDRQIKIRGFRVETEEIELCLREHPMIDQAAVKTTGETESQLRLDAYVKPHLQHLEEIYGFKRYLLPNNLAVAQLNKNETDYIYREIFQLQAYTRYGVSIDNEATILDVGSNIGLFSLFTILRSPGARIFAFEPNPAVFEILRANATLYIPKARLFNCGIGRENGRLPFTFLEGFSLLSGLYVDRRQEREMVLQFMKNQGRAGAEGMERLLAEAEDLLERRFASETFEVQIRTISSIIDEHAIEQVDFLKINVEKAELDVLEGISSHHWPRIRQVVLEVDVETHIGPITRILEQNGFEWLLDQDLLLEGTQLRYIYAIRPGSRAVLVRDKKDSSLPLPALENPFEIELRIRKTLDERLPRYMIPANIYILEHMPLTANGKVDRRALTPVMSAKKSRLVLPRNDVETALAAMWASVLDAPQTSIGIDDDFFDRGGHSLKATILAARINKQFDADFPIRLVFEFPTIRAMGRYLERQMPGCHCGILPVEEKDYYPVSPAQQRLYFIEQLGNAGTTYNMFTALSIEGAIDEQKLEASFRRLVERHESFRTSFFTVAGRPAQRIHRQVEFRLEIIDGMRDRFVRPFQLAKAPLLRVGLEKIGDLEHLLLIDMHHIISDGTSMGIIHRDLSRLYNGEPLEALHLQYRDYAVWQRLREEAGDLERQKRFWLDCFPGEIPRLELPADFPRPTSLTFAGDRHLFQLDRQTSAGFLSHCRENDVTLFMNLLAAFNVLMHYYTGQQDIVTGTGVMGRPHADTEDIVGMFINALALRNFPTKDTLYLDFLQEVKKTCIAAFDNQGAQFDEVVDRLGVQRDPSRNPLFDVMVVVQNFQQPAIRAQGVTFAPLEKTERTSKFDMTLFAYQYDDSVQFKWEYNIALFKKETIRRMATHLISIIRRCTDSLRKFPIGDIDIMTPAEKLEILIRLNRTESSLPKSSTIISLFLDQVKENPNRTALAGGRAEIHLSYDCLFRRAEELALFLKVQRDDERHSIVAILMEQGIDCIVAIMGVLLSGFAYLPIDPAFPENRMRLMLDDVGARMLLSQKKFIRVINRLQWECRSLIRALVLDSHNATEEAEVELSQLMERGLWEYVGEKAIDDITGGGWQNSFTGEPFSREEMDEYGDNVLRKLKPLLNEKMRILEIGSASGITMFRLAPLVRFYLGCDLSQPIIDRNREIIEQEGIDNIELACLAAHEIDRIAEEDFDIVIINSVIQCFHGHNYLRQVLKKAVAKMRQTGFIFAGDIMDLDLKKELERDLNIFKEEQAKPHQSTRADWSTELFLQRDFFEDLMHEIPEFHDIQFSDKIHTIENELTRYRYDVLIRVDRDSPKSGSTPSRHKFLLDRRALRIPAALPKRTIVEPHDPAYIIFTSGSTGIPKGALATHRNVVRVVKDTNYLDLQPCDRILQLSNTAFDGSVFDIFAALLNGATLVLPSGTTEQGFDIIQLANILKRGHISVFFLTTALFNSLVEIDIDCFSGVRKILFGGERISTAHALRALRYLGPERLLHVYGPTETTVFATCYPIDHIDEQASTIPIGRPISNTSAYVLDNLFKPAPYGVVGELCIGGEGLVAGYLNNPDQTAERFVDWYGNGNGERLYRSGDLARLLPEQGGQIEFIGRADRQVKIRGFRIELSEIEHHLTEMNQIREAVVLDVDSPGGGKILEAWFVPSDRYIGDIGEVKEKLAAQCPEFMIPASITAVGEIPLTANGKVDRKRLLAKRKMGEIDGYSGAANPVEESLLQIWSSLLGLPVNAIAMDSDFFQLGGHSLKATMLVAKVHQQLGVKLPLAEVFRTPTIRGLAEYIDARPKTSHTEIRPSEKRDYYPLSSAQQRMYILQQSIKHHTGYNMPAAFQLTGALDLSRVQHVFSRLLARHESLRTSFVAKDDSPVQRIADSLDAVIEHWKCLADEAMPRFIRPFRLGDAPLVRLGLLPLVRDHHLLMIDMHHIISDGVSLAVLVREFMDIYIGAELPQLAIQYRDYAIWEERFSLGGEMKLQMDYWLHRFSGELPLLELPLDFPRPRERRFTGDTVNCSLEEGLVGQLRILCRETNVTMFLMLSSLLRILLAKLCRQSDVVIGTPVSGRTRDRLEQVVGMFVNTLPLRGQVPASSSFLEYLVEVKTRTLDDFQNQDYPFDRLVDDLAIPREGGRNPLFDVMFSLQNIDIPSLQIPGLTLEPFSFLTRQAVFDLTFTMAEAGNRVHLSIEYSDALFKRETVERLFIAGFTTLARHATFHPGTQISRLEYVSPLEKEDILQKMNAALSRPSMPPKTVIRLIEEQIVAGPDHIALFDGRFVTYKEMMIRCRRLSDYLYEQGFGRESIAAISSSRSLEMAMGILAVMFAGGAYLPIDPKLPEERIRWMLKDSAAQICLDEEMLQRGSTCSTEEKAPEAITPEDLAYVIYTSGSTGRPKGVMMDHRGLGHFIAGARNVFEGSFSRYDRCLSTANIVFDVSVAEIFLALTCGGALFLMPDREIYDAEDIGRAILVHCVTFAYIPPSLLSGVSDYLESKMRICGLDKLLAGVEPIRGTTLAAYRRLNPRMKIVNGYGPTEAAICATMYVFEDEKPSSAPVPIGGPLGGTSIYIVNSHRQIQPKGVAGEILIGGDGLARGYLNDAEMTERQFLSDGGLRLYATGDMARLEENDVISFIGRRDNQVKIRGHRIELDEISRNIEQIPFISRALATVHRRGDDDDLLVAYVTVKEQVDEHIFERRCKHHLRQRLPSYMIPGVILIIPGFPLTAAGKIDTASLPEPLIEAGNEAKTPMTAPEHELASIWGDILGIDSAAVGPHSDFFSLGGHSLKAIRLISRLRHRLNVDVTLEDIFHHSTIRRLASHIQSIPGCDDVFIGPFEKMEYYPLSGAQRRIYLAWEQAPESTVYNMPAAIRLHGTVDHELLKTCFRTLYERHDSFRASFFMYGEELVQRYVDGMELIFEDADIDSFIRPFHLEEPPLLRVSIQDSEEDDCLLLVDMHHIASDGTSVGILIRELAALYRDGNLPLSRLSYKDFALWQNRFQGGHPHEWSKQKMFWSEMLKEELPLLPLPLDFPKTAGREFRGGELRFDLDLRLTGALLEMANLTGTTMFNVMLAIYIVLLARLSNQQDVIVGTASAGRNREEWQNIVGMFINTLPLRNFPRDDTLFDDFLLDVGARSLAAFQNQDVQLDEMMPRMPFDVFYVFQNMDLPKVAIGDAQVQFLSLERTTAKFDLLLDVSLVDGLLRAGLEYNYRIFKRETAGAFVRYFFAIATAVAEDPGLRIGEIELLSPAEKKKLLSLCTGPDLCVDYDKPLIQLFEEQAVKHPDRTALAHEGHLLCYGALNLVSEAMGRRLATGEASLDSIIAISLPPGPEAVIAMLASLKAGAAFLMIPMEYPEHRMKQMIIDSGVSMLICDKNSQNPGPWIPEKISSVEPLEGNDLEPARMELKGRIRSAGDHPLYVVYTSGSTGAPRGVLMGNRALINLIAFQLRYTSIDFSRVSQLASLGFDVAVQEIFTTFAAGGRLQTLDHSRKSDVRYLFDVLIRYDIKTVFFPTAFFKFLFGSSLLSLDFPSSVRHIVVAGERLILSPEAIAYLKAAAVVLHNHYGPSETHVVATWTIDREERMEAIPPIGAPIANSGAFVLNRKGLLQPTGVPGELWICGPAVGIGYLNLPHLTQDRFLDPHTNISSASTWYRTGDLACVRADGALEFLGRLDRQLKIRGFRVEPGDIESALLSYDSVDQAVVVGLEGEDNQTSLVAYITTQSKQNTSGDEMKRFLQSKLPSYMIPGFIVQMEKIPLTPNGKVDLGALPIPEFFGRRDPVLPANQMEERLLRLWSRVLGIADDCFGVTDDFFALGGHSLKAAMLASHIEQKIALEFPLREIFNHPTIRRQAEFIASCASKTRTWFEPLEARDYYPLSPAQRRIFLLQQIVGERPVYNMPFMYRLASEPDEAKIERTFVALIQRHDSFRTSFEEVDGEPVQRIHKRVKFELELLEDCNRWIRPFDLSEAPLVRVGLARAEEDGNLLMIDIHHIVCDGISLAVVMEEFLELYSTGKLPEAPLQYKDAVFWHDDRDHLDYWLRELREPPQSIDLPSDFQRSRHNFSGNIVNIQLDSGETASLKRLASSLGCTYFMILVAAYSILLSRLSGQEDIIVGTPVSGRGHPQLERCIGMFVNTLAIRLRPLGHMPVEDFLLRVRDTVLGALEHQDVPFEEVAAHATVSRDPSHNPLFDVMFTLNNVAAPTISSSELALQSMDVRTGLAKFHLTLGATDAGDKTLLTFEYSDALFKEETVRRWAAHFARLTSGLPSSLKQPLCKIELLSHAQKKELEQWLTGPSSLISTTRELSLIFMEQCLATPDRVAMQQSASGFHMSYDELMRRTESLAFDLASRGVGNGCVVAVPVADPALAILSMMGILLAGAVYLPLDESLPSRRIEFILNDSGACCIVGDRPEGLFDFQGIVFRAEESFVGIKSSGTLPSNELGSPAYIVYTSGSTGTPKGAVIPRFAVTRIARENGYLTIHATDRLLQWSNLAFDGSVFDIYGAFLNGANLVIPTSSQRISVERLGECINREAVTLFFVTTAMFNALVDESLPCLHHIRHILFGGERVSLPHATKAARFLGTGNVTHVYGPTEATVFATHHGIDTIIDEFDTTVPIGKPVANTKLHLLDRYHRHVPVGVIGEIWIEGGALALGYLNRPEATCESFCHIDLETGNGEITLYRSGDLGRMNARGAVEFVGRKDRQLKIRGFRIEMGEIEHRLRCHHEVRDATVVPVDEPGGVSSLVAYVVPEPGFALDDVLLRRFLEEALPAYMIPAHIVALEKIPVNANGKVDRSLLPGYLKTNKTDAQLPRTDLQQRVSDLWRKVLSIESAIAVDDDFFRLGGHSIKASIMLKRVRDMFGVSVPLPEFFKQPTIRFIESILTSNDGLLDEIDYRLVKLKQGNDGKSPLFLIHAGSGEVEGYLELCLQLEANYSCWGIRVNGDDYSAPVKITVQQLAEDYLRLIRRIQSSGPYRLAGWCIGGVIAFEMALQLQRQGEAIEFLGLINSSAPSYRPPLDSIFPEAAVIEMMPMDTIKIALPEVWKLAIPGIDQLSREELLRYIYIIFSLDRARNVYIPQANLASPVHYFAATQFPMPGRDGWNRFTIKPIRFWDVPGDHFSIFSMPRVLKLAQTIAAALGNPICKLPFTTR